MNFAATVSFSIDNAKPEHYDIIYKELEKGGLPRNLEGSADGKPNTVRLPETTVYGKFTGTSAEAVRELVTKTVNAAYKTAKVSGKFFTAVGGESTTWQVDFPKGA